jgi:hypothetical protein
MNAYKSAAIMNAAMWIAVSAAIITVVLVTGKGSWLWFFLVPLFGGYKVKPHRVDED